MRSTWLPSANLRLVQSTLRLRPRPSSSSTRDLRPPTRAGVRRLAACADQGDRAALKRSVAVSPAVVAFITVSPQAACLLISFQPREKLKQSAVRVVHRHHQRVGFHRVSVGRAVEPR